MNIPIETLAVGGVTLLSALTLRVFYGAAVKEDYFSREEE
jgi:hypothetical protein